jgi:charged multivesicular body protein 1
MDKFETQFADLDVQTSQMEGSINSSLATTTPQDQVDLLMQQVADEAGLEIKHGLEEQQVPENLISDAQAKNKSDEQEDALAARLRALRPAS